MSATSPSSPATGGIGVARDARASAQRHCPPRTLLPRAASRPPSSERCRVTFHAPVPSMRPAAHEAGSVTACRAAARRALPCRCSSPRFSAWPQSWSRPRAQRLPACARAQRPRARPALRRSPGLAAASARFRPSSASSIVDCTCPRGLEALGDHPVGAVCERARAQPQADLRECPPARHITARDPLATDLSTRTVTNGAGASKRLSSASGARETRCGANPP